MKKRQNFSINLLLLITVFLVFANSCKKDDDNISSIPVLSTSEVTKICQITAQCGGVITSDANFAITARGVCWNTSVNPTIMHNKTTDGLGSGSFTSKLTGLQVGTTYYLRAYATNSEGTAYGSTMIFETLGNTFTDSRDGNVYKIVTIGDQIWMAENLRATKYADGTAIPLVNNETSWNALTTTSKAYCWYNDDIANKATYGALYTWAAAMNGAASTTSNPSGIQGVCPTGWHLPSDAEWTQMENHLADNGHNYDGTTGGGGAKIAKSLANISGWNSSSTTGAAGNTDYPAYRNKSGFTALPGGYRIGNGTFGDVGYGGNWWNATEYSAASAWSRNVGSSKGGVDSYDNLKDIGFSVRCVRDY
jgi:uncharacterized protein (TIGR02145 family)